MDPKSVLARATLSEGQDVALHRSDDKRRRKAIEPGRPAIAQADAPETVPRWVAARSDPALGSLQSSADGSEDAAFRSGAAVFAVDRIIRADLPWRGSWQMRLVLKAAVAATRLLGPSADEAGLRDALHLTRVGDDPGPAGRLHDLLRKWTMRPLRLAGETEAEVIAEVGEGAGAAEFAALLAADRMLAQRVGWGQVLPLHLAAIHHPALKRGSNGRRPRADEPDWEANRYGVLLHGALSAHAEAVTLGRRAAALSVAAASLRTRDEGRGLALILADDCVAPWRMVGRQGMNSDRAARRFCETLHAKGALRLLTERATFRSTGYEHVQNKWASALRPRMRQANLAMPSPKPGTPAGLFDTELADLPSAVRWREWMGRVEAAVLRLWQARATGGAGQACGAGLRLDDLIADIRDELKGRPYELVFVAGGWQHRTRARFAEAVRAAAKISERDQPPELTKLEALALAAIAYRSH